MPVAGLVSRQGRVGKTKKWAQILLLLPEAPPRNKEVGALFHGHPTRVEGEGCRAISPLPLILQAVFLVWL